MRWILYLAVVPSNSGAARFGQWLQRGSVDCKSTAKAADVLIGAHIIDRKHVAAYLREESSDHIVQRGLDAVDYALREVEAEGLVEEVKIEVDADEVGRLLTFFVESEADGIVVARARKNADRPSAHLGPMVHRLLRRHVAPVIVVPPDFSPDTLGAGPVVMATDLEEDSAAAGQFAVRFAAEHARPLVFCHVLPDPDDALAPYLPSSAIDQVADDHLRDARERFSQWCASFGIDEGELRIVNGDPARGVIDLASEVHSPLIVTGSRSKTNLERLFVGSVALDLAGSAFCSVAVIPPTAP